MANPFQGHEEELQAALSVAEGAAPRLECFRDGRIICGLVCRLTIGRLALMNVAGCRIFSGKEELPDESDVLKALYFTVEDNLDESVWLADDSGKLDKKIKRFFNGFDPFQKREAMVQLNEWFLNIAASLPQGSGTESGGRRRVDWWVDAVDTLASEYHWREGFILWQLPLVRAIKYAERIGCRIEGRPVVDDISDNVMAALDMMEGILKDGKSET